MIWQMNWKSWGLQWTKDLEEMHWDEQKFQVYSNYLIIGPLQMHWYSK